MAKELFNTNGDQTSEFKFRFKINTKVYGKRFGLDIPDDGADAILTGDPNVNEGEAEDAATFSFSSPQVKTDLAHCKAQNPLTCRFHGVQALASDIEAHLIAQGVNGQVNVEILDVDTSNGAQYVSAEATVVAPSSDQTKVEAALKAFYQLDGIEGDDTMSGLTHDGNAFSDFFEIDLLDPKAQARWKFGQNSASATGSAQAGSAQTSAPQPTTPPSAQNQQSQTTPPQNQAPLPAQTPAPAPTSATPTPPNQPTKAPTPRVAAIKGVAKLSDDKKSLKALVAKGGSKKACDDIADLVSKKESLLDDAKKMKDLIKSAPSGLTKRYKDVYAKLADKIKDVSTKITDAIDAEDKATTARAQSSIGVGDRAVDIKAKLSALQAAGKINFVPKMLDFIDAKVDKKEKNVRNFLAINGLSEVLDNATWDTLKDLFSQSMGAYLTKCDFRTYCGANTILEHFIDKQDYNPRTSKSFNTDFYGVSDVKERGTCCSATIADYDPFDPIQSHWDDYRSDRACVNWRTDNTVIAYSSVNLGSAFSIYGDREDNSSLITNPSLTSLYRAMETYAYAQTKGEIVKWLKNLISTGTPDLSLDREKVKELFSAGGDHDECHVFSGNAEGRDLLNHIKAFEFLNQSDAQAAVRLHGAKLKQYGIKIYWGNSRTEVPNP